MAEIKTRATLSRENDRKEALPEHAAPEEVIRALLGRHELTQDELARMIGADERSIRRWATNGESVSVQARHAEAIDDLRHLQSVLSPSLPGVQFARWLRARNRQLGGERPVDLIVEDRYQEVLEAATAFADGIYS